MKKMKLNRFLVSLILIIIAVTSYSTIISTEDKNIYYPAEYTNEYDILVDKQKENVKERLITEVKTYIYSQSPKANKDIAKHLVEKCLESNIDICFAMSQSEIETNFGTTGAGRQCSRRSMFGVANKYYSSYFSAIIDYINVLKTFYLKNGRTEKHLMNNYITINGNRYASNLAYEKDLRKAYKKIKSNTNIYSLQKQYNTM